MIFVLRIVSHLYQKENNKNSIQLFFSLELENNLKIRFETQNRLSCKNSKNADTDFVCIHMMKMYLNIKLRVQRRTENE